MLPWRAIDELVVQPLVVPLAVVVRFELGNHSPRVSFTERDDAIEAFLFN
jgi:hypothetical protein